MHYGGKKSKQNGGKGHRIFTPNKLDILLFRPESLCKISWKSNNNYGRRSDDRHTDWL